MTVKESIRQRALDLGFDLCRFTSAAPPASGQQLNDWLADGKHGEMGWLQRNAHKRTDPQQVLPGAKSLICLATSYHADAWRKEDAPGQGALARYARHQDYHDVLVEPLKQLSDFVDAQGGTGTRSLWYVDTGPILERDLAQRAGLGFVGKHTNLISRQLGTTFIFSTHDQRVIDFADRLVKVEDGTIRALGVRDDLDRDWNMVRIRNAAEMVVDRLPE